MFGGGKKHRAYDDSCLAVEPERTVVSLRGHDFTGLGFNICGNMRDGIMVKDVLHRGPASESGLIKAGDKILNVTVSFSNIVYEDALTILSYASPYDVQLEIERIPDKSRNTPTTSKRLGSCSFNNSGQKLFHPLYRSQSIDDLTQIDRDTFPSHGIGPRRSQSIGVAAHKLAAHFKNSDSKLEDKDRNPMSLVLSTTGSLNEKMLANVMSDGSHHKNGLQWEKRFEDTLESEDSSVLSDNKRDAKSMTSTSTSNEKTVISTKESAVRKSNENLVASKNYKQKNSKYLDSPYNNEKLEIHKSPIDKNEIDGSVTVQVHQPERMSGRRAKTMAQATGALWQLDQSIRDDDSSLSNLDSPRYSQRNTSKVDNLPHSPVDRFSQREEGDESDVSRDSLETSSDKIGRQRLSELKQTTEIRNNGLPSSAINKQYQNDKKSGINMKNNSGKVPDNVPRIQSERVYANNVINNSMVAVAGNTEQRLQRDKASHSEIKPENSRHDGDNSYSNHREAMPKELPHRVVPNSANDTHQSVNSEHFTQNYAKATRITVNGEASEPKNKFVVNSVAQSNSPVDYKQYQRNDLEVRSNSNENKSKPSPLQQQVFNKKTANPAGMFTQINPFQMPSKQKNLNLKSWVGREDSNRDSPIHTNELQQSHGNYITISDTASQQNRRSNALPEPHSYNQRMGDRTRTVIMSSYENSPYGSIHSSQNSNFKHH
ncbi:bromodomain-containing protein DDB_G0270170 isoform X2 [Parasteatoda tepidariorum]|nr:uncharacterized protein LOC107436423 isoform X2 [Parasteatoda tepidariorum]